MDFIVLGAILGGLLVIGGSVLRDAVPARLGPGEDDTPWVTVRDRRRTARTARTAGRVLVLAGTVMLAVTVILALLDTSDGAALATVVGLAVVSVLACAGWVAWYRYQESSGAIQRRQLRAVAARLGPVARPSDGRAGPERGQSGARGERRPGADRDPADGSVERSRSLDRRAERPNAGTRHSGRAASGRPVLASDDSRRPERRENGDRAPAPRGERRAAHDSAHAVVRGRAARPAPGDTDGARAVRPDAAAGQRPDDRSGWSTRRDPAERR